MPIDNNKLKKVWDTLRNGGYTQDYKTFVKGFSGDSNYENRKKVYDLLTENGAQIGKDYGEFMSKLHTDTPIRRAPQPKPTPTVKNPLHLPEGFGTVDLKDPMAKVRDANEVSDAVRGIESGNAEKAAAGRKKLAGVSARLEKEREAAKPAMDLLSAPLTEEQKSYVRHRKDAADYQAETGRKMPSVFGAGFERFGMLDADDYTKGVAPARIFVPEAERDEKGRITGRYSITSDKGAQRADRDARQGAIDSLKTIDAEEAEKERLSTTEGKEAEIADTESRIKELDAKMAARRRKLGIPQGGGTLSIAMNVAANADEEYNALSAARRQEELRLRSLKDRRFGGNDDYWWQIYRGAQGAVEKFLGYDTASDLAKYRAAGSASGFDKGVDEARQMFMEALDKNEREQAVAAGSGGLAREFGQLTGNSAIYMLPFMFGGKVIGGIQTLSRAAMRGAVKTAAGQAARKGVASALGRYTKRALGAVAEDMAIGLTGASTVGMPATLGQAAENYAGKLEQDENGRYYYTGGDDTAHAFVTALLSNSFEYSSEMAGEHMESLWKAGKKSFAKTRLGMSIDRLFAPSKDGNRLVRYYNGIKSGAEAWLERLRKTKAGSAAYNAADFITEGGARMFRHAHIQDLPFEGLEEELNNIENAAFQTGQGSWEDVADNEQRWKLWAGLAISMATTGAVFGGISTVQYGGRMAGQYRAKHLMDRADVLARYRMTEEVWKPIKDGLDNADNADMGTVIAKALGTVKTDEERKEILNYARRLLEYRGYNIATTVGAAQGDGGADAGDMAYSEGYETTDANDMHNIKTRYEEARRKVEADGVNPDGTDVRTHIEMMLGARNEDGTPYYTDEEVQPYIDYLNAKAAFDGSLERVRDDIDSGVAESEAAVDRRTGKDGMVHPAVMKQPKADGTERSVYILAGNVEFTGDGGVVIDPKDTRGSIVVCGEDGTMEMVSPDAIREVGDAIDPETEKEEAAEAVRQRIAQDAADKFDNTPKYGVNDTFVMTGADGTPVSGVVQRVSEDGVEAAVGGRVALIPTEQFEAAVQEVRDAYGNVSWRRTPEDAAEADVQENGENVPNTTENVPNTTESVQGTPGNAPQDLVEEQKPDAAVQENGNSDAVGRSLSESETETVISEMKSGAQAAPEMELNPKNWLSQFGEDGVVTTPIGNVKMGENQYFKLAQRGRDGKLGMVKPTLETPDVIVEDSSKAKENGAEERPSSYVFVKTFTKADGSRYYHFTSVTVSKDGGEVVVSNQEKSENRISRLLRNGRIVWIDAAFSLHPTAQDRVSVPLGDSNRLTPTDSQSALLGVSSPEHSAGKDTEQNSDMQAEGGENASALSLIPKDANGEPVYTAADAYTAWDALVEQCGGDAGMAQGVADSMVKDMETALKKAEKSAPAHGVTVAEKIAAAKGHKAAVEKARTELEKWRAIAGETASRARAAEEAERRRKKERLDAAREELRRNGRYAKEDAALGDYTDFADYAMRTIATGKYRFLWGDRESGTQGLGAHLGFTGSRTERNKRIWLLSKDGFTPEEAAERMLADYSAAAGFDSVGDTGVDSMEALDVILDVLRRYTSPRAMMDDAKAAHAENGESAEERRQGEEYERGQFMEAYHMTPEEYYEYENEWLPRYMEEAVQVPQEVIDNINAEYAEKYSENGKDDYNGGEDARGVPPVQGERLDKPGGDEGGGDTGGAAGAVGEGDAAGGFVPQGASGREVRAGEVPQPVGKGAFGDIYDQFRGDAKAAFDFLTKHRSGDLLGVFHRDDTGDIDLVWGDENSGLSHILTKHVGKGKDFGTEQAAFDKIESILKNGKLIQDGRLRYVVSEDGYRVSIRKDYDGVKKNWIVTAVDYNRSKEEKEITTNPTSASHGANGPELAAPNNSKGKVTEESADLQEKKEKSEEPKSEEKNSVDDAKIEAVSEALSKGDEKAEQLVQGLTNRELSKLRSKVKASPLLENEWLRRVRTRGDVSLHDRLLESQYVEPVKRVSGTFKMTDYITPKNDKEFGGRLSGVYHDDKGYAVASDGRILVADKGSYDPKQKGKVIGKDGTVSESKFPDWQKVISAAKETKSSNIDVEDLRKFVAGVLRANKRAYISLRFPDGTTRAFNANRLNLMLRAMKRLGTDKLLYTKDGMKLVAKSDKGAALLVGLMSAEDELVKKYGYAYPGNTVSYHRGEVVSEMSPGERALRDAVIDRLRESGMEVITDEESGQRVLDEANGKAKLSAKKRRALETVSASHDEKHQPTVVLSADGAKILKELDDTKEKYKNLSNRMNTFIGDVAKALGAKRGGSASEYASFETKNGKIITIRLSNHNAKVSNFDANGETDGISIVVSPKKSAGIADDGNAHVVEYYYDAIKLRRAEGKPLADIVRSIKQALYSGEFEDTTGLAERQEVNAETTDRVRFFRIAKGEAYGFTVGGKIYIDPKIANAETPIHEYAHLWAAALRGQNPKEWHNIVELMKGTSVWDEVKKRYPELNADDGIADEVLATYSGRRGAERLREEQRKIAGGKGGVFEKAEAISALERVKQALRKFWKSVADFLHIHYKSAEEVADRVMKDLLDGVDPGKHFNSRNDDPRFMFAGEKGAARADREEEALTRQNNLDVAQKMEAAKKEAKAIKWATGWERGADGKWRYEIPDGIYHPKGDAELKKALAKQPWGEELNGLSDRILDGEELSKEETEHFNELAEKEAAFKADYLKKEKPHLADWLENDELFKAYPELKRVGIVFTDNMPKEQAGYYDSKSNTITVNTNSLEDTASIIAHEVQHAIQRFEGFATGGNLKAAMEYLSGNKRADVKIKQQLAYKLSQEKGLGLSEEEVNSLIGHLEYEDISDDELQKQIDALCQKHNITEDQLEDIYPLDSVWHEAYNRISGETEARNVQKRMGMTAEERRVSLAADTEDVARDGQILLFDDKGENMSLESPKEDDINAKFNIRLAELVKNPDQKDKVLHLGRSSKFLTDGGLADAEIILEFDKLAHKSKEGYKHEHPFDISDIKDLPKAISSPIAVFDNTNGKNDGRVILTELKKDGRNFIVAVKTSAQNRRGGIVLEVNQITTLFPKDAKGIVYWFNSGKATNIDKEKALRFIEALPNHPGTTIKEEELFSAAKVVENFEKTKLSEEGGIEKIIADAKEKGTYMLAPNGEKSNLNERQWAQVRTTAFKNWFGDWENDPENSSKVVDENGEPLVVDGLFLNLKESPLPKMKKAFLRAKELAEMGRKAEKDSGYQIDSSEFAYSEEGDAFLEEYMRSSGSVQNLCDCLLKGYTPKPVVTFRYGEIRDNQRSYNYRDDIFEKGVSVVGKVSEMNTKKSWYYDAFWGNGENYNIVIGYDIDESGADGEMLLTKANVIGKAKDMARIVKSATGNNGKFSKKEDDIRYRAGSKELRDGRKIDFVRKPTATYNALARHLQAEGIKPDMHEARTGSRYMSFGKDGVQWEVRSSDHTKPEYYGEAQKPVELTYYKDKQGEENLSVNVDLGTSGYNVEDMKALMAEIDRLKNDAGEVKESFDRGVASDEVMERYPLLSQALGVKSENEVRAKEEAGEHAEEVRKQEMRSAVEDMAGKLHLNNVDIVDKPAERGAGRRERAKGMFERSTGRITINIGNCADKRDAVVTLLHEAVAHHGLRKLFGENFETFLDNVYNSANAEIRRIIDKHSSRYGGDKRTATEEYMASLAERTDFENAKKSGWWQRIKDFFLKMLEKIGLKGFKGEDLSDNELRYVLWRSYENLKSGGKDTVFSAADDLAKQSELKVGEFAPDAKAEESVTALNTRFNNELQQQIDGNLPSNHIYQMGNPGKILLSTGVPDLPIQMNAKRLQDKATLFDHNFELYEVKDLVKALQNPLAVFSYGDKTKAQNIIVPLQKDGKNFIVGLSLNPTVGGKALEINSIRNVFPKDNSEWLNWISQGKALYLDKEKIQILIAQQRTNLADVEYLDLDSAAKVVENFENPKSESENDALFRDGDAKDYEKAQARDRYERRVRSGLFQSREALQDSMLSLKVAMDEIEKATNGKGKHIEDYDGYENAYLGENRLSSVNPREVAAFTQLHIVPMLKEVNRLAPTAKERAELVDYMFAKHGLERNEYMRQREAEKKYDTHKKKHPDSSKTVADFTDESRDYAGLTALTGKDDVLAAETEARRMAAEYEKDHAFHGTWNEIYVCRKKIC